jgi:triacylglycerol lipase
MFDMPIVNPSAASPPTVALIHGLGRTSRSLRKLGHALQSEGFRVCYIDYPSQKYAIDALTREHVLPQLRRCQSAPDEPLYFVTHSLGGIVLRQLHRLEPNLPIARAVMLAPPNQGSELVDAMGNWKLFQWINGPAGTELSTDAASTPNQLGPVRFELGVIAGSKNYNPLFAGQFSRAHDGKVAVESTKVEGMRAHSVVPVTHTFIMRNAKVIQQTLRFLREGRFEQ